MKNILFILLLIVGMAKAYDSFSSRFSDGGSEVSGFIVGSGIGFSHVKYKSSTTDLNTYLGTPSYYYSYSNAKINRLHIEILGGYQYFINKYVGIRAYLVVAYIGEIDFNADFDLMINFINRSSWNMGIYIGAVPVGLVEYKYTTLEHNYIGRYGEKTDEELAYYIAANAGIRFSIYQHHNIDLAFQYKVAISSELGRDALSFVTRYIYVF